VEGNQDKKRDTLGTGKFDRKHYRLIMVMELRVQVWNLQGRVDFKKVAKAIDSDKFDVYAFHQSTTLKLKELIDVSDALKTYEFYNDGPRSNNVLAVNPAKFSVTSNESLGSAGDLYELQQVSGSDKTYIASINFESSRSQVHLLKKLRNDDRLLNGTLMVSAKYNNTKFKELMKGRLDLPKDNALFTYVHRMNNDYETRVIKRTFKGGGMIVPSAMRVYKDIPVSVAPTLTGGSVGERPLYYGIKLTGDSSLAHLSKRHTFVGVTHDKPMTDVFDTHMTFRTDAMTSYVEKENFEVIQAVYEESGHSMHAIYGKKLDMNVLYININIDVDHKDILDIAIQKLDKLSGVPDVVVIAGTFAEKLDKTIAPFDKSPHLKEIVLQRIDVYSRDPKVCTYKC
jgi:hypothetical protein